MRSVFGKNAAKIGVYLVLLFVLFCSTSAKADTIPTWAAKYNDGSSSWFFSKSVCQTSDGGYAVAGWSDTFPPTARILLILKLDSKGILEWQKYYPFPAWYGWYGSSVKASVISLQQTSDGGFVVLESMNGIPGSTYGYMALTKLDSQGNIQWSKGSWAAEAGLTASLQQTSEGGYIVAGNQSAGSGTGPVITKYNGIMYLTKQNPYGSI